MTRFVLSVPKLPEVLDHASDRKSVRRLDHFNHGEDHYPPVVASLGPGHLYRPSVLMKLGTMMSIPLSFCLKNETSGVTDGTDAVDDVSVVQHIQDTFPTKGEFEAHFAIDLSELPRVVKRNAVGRRRTEVHIRLIVLVNNFVNQPDPVVHGKHLFDVDVVSRVCWM